MMKKIKANKMRTKRPLMPYLLAKNGKTARPEARKILSLRKSTKMTTLRRNPNSVVTTRKRRRKMRRALTLTLKRNAELKISDSKSTRLARVASSRGIQLLKIKSSSMLLSLM